jgi:hypothetical protein
MLFSEKMGLDQNVRYIAICYLLPIGFLPVETSDDSVQSNDNHNQTSKPVSTSCVEHELEEQSHNESVSSEVSLFEEVQDGSLFEEVQDGQYSDE